MHLYAIGDLHLSFTVDKPMDRFGQNWLRHPEKIRENWLSTVSNEDTVIVAGDISWGTKLREAKEDLDFISRLPGKKIMVKGNHDYWWTSTNKLEELYPEMIFIRKNYTIFGEYAVCGSRGWLCPNDQYFKPQDMKIYKREQKRLRDSLEEAIKDGMQKIILAMHFPPTNDKREHSAFLDIIDSYPICHVIYGHLHGENSFFTSYLGDHKNVNYHLVSSDFLEFKPLRII